jgi:hypothetical protein
MLVGAAIAFLWSRLFQVPVDYWLVIIGLWLVVVGLPSLYAMVDFLLKKMGYRERPWPRLTNDRLIPVGQSYAFDTVLSPFRFVGNSGQVTPERAVELPEIEIQTGDYLITQEVLLRVLRTAWQRQNRGRSPFSRTWWVEESRSLERGEYESIMETLAKAGLIVGRTQGRSGKLRYPPLKSLDELIERI